MDFNISEHGDILEREYSEFIRSNIPSYEEIWKRYIGNDGKNKMMILDGLSIDEQRERELFSQYHYTILESFACLDLLTTHLIEFRVNPENKVRCLLEFNNMLLAYWGNIGRIRDNISKILDFFGLGNLISTIEKFYQTRNQILHDRKLPFNIIDGEILIPVIESGVENNEAWHTSKSWFEMKPNNYNVMSDFHAESFREYLNIINKLLYNVLSKVIEICDRKKITITANPKIDYTAMGDTSGSADIVSITVVKE